MDTLGMGVMLQRTIPSAAPVSYVLSVGDVVRLLAPSGDGNA
jgi:hypothetical protein